MYARDSCVFKSGFVQFYQFSVLVSSLSLSFSLSLLYPDITVIQLNPHFGSKLLHWRRELGSLQETPERWQHSSVVWANSRRVARIKNKERPLGEVSGRGTGSHVERGRGLAITWTRV